MWDMLVARQMRDRAAAGAPRQAAPLAGGERIRAGPTRDRFAKIIIAATHFACLKIQFRRAAIRMDACDEFRYASLAVRYASTNEQNRGGSAMKLSRFGCLALGVSLLLLGGHELAAQSAVNYHLIKTVPLPQAPGTREYYDYVYVDADARRVYVTHGTEVLVLNADNYSVIGKIGGLQLSHAVVTIKELGKGYITDGDGKKVVIFDLNTFKVTGEVVTNQVDTDALVYDPASKYLFSINGNSGNMTVIDPVKETAVKLMDLGGAAEFGVVDGQGTLYNNNEGKNDIVVIDTRTLTIKERWPTAPAGTVTGLAMDLKNKRLFSAGRNPQFLVMMDATNGKVLQSFPISGGIDAAVFEPETGLVFASTRDGRVHIYHEDSPDKLTPVQALMTEYGAKTMAVDPKTHNIWVSTSDFDQPATPTEKQPNPLPRAKQGNFRVLVYGR
jgi:DNA-binding beta-propeller fold protein YncE